ncbi:MAG: repressor LexA [Gammaproteobacteria bacterium]|nr:repressor LexA [Gammaproteobacteria bacterium]NKB64923.1 repressor LexA [Gammaproteobacteria bacterium]
MKPIEQKILDFISGFEPLEQQSLTVEQIANGVDYRSRGSVHRYLKSLITQGFLTKTKGKRGLVCTGKPKADHILPFLGKIAAGKPIEAIQNSQELDLTELFAGPDRFVLQVTDDSMIDAGIHDHDYIVVHQADTARNGDIVVALIDQDEVTLKRFYTISDNRIRLIPENIKMEPLNYPADRVRIQGVVIGQMRKY